MSETFILIGFLLFVVVILPILLVRDYLQKKKVRQIIESYKSEVDESNPPVEEQPEKQQEGSGGSGWGMNNSPFRERKSDLSWGGGNIKASEAKRVTRRKFLK